MKNKNNTAIHQTLTNVIFGDRYLIIDNFLPNDEFEVLWNFIQSSKFEPVHTKQWTKAFRLNDGVPFWADVSISHPRLTDHSASVYPTGEGIDVFIEALLKKTDELHAYIGTHKTDWDFFFARPYLYPTGTGLSWHTDGKFEISAAYVFYCHPEWKPAWGSELLIDSSGDFDRGYPEKMTNHDKLSKIGYHLDQKEIDNFLLEKGIGHYILPKPNRLVIIKPNTLHRIKPVDPSAGDNVRASIAGFFMNDQKIESIKKSENL